MAEYIVELDSKHSIALKLAFAEEMRGGDFLREEIVRCRDCKWFTPEHFYEEERGFGVVEILSDPPDCGNPERCSHHYDSLAKKTVPVHIATDPDGFCAWGKRKEDDE